MMMTPHDGSATLRDPQPPQPRLLIAEDNDLVGRQLKTCLEADPGVRVDVVRDGKQALAALQSNFYSIFLTDLQMPHLDGMQLIQEIASRNIPVTTIVVTGHGSIDSAVEALRAGAYDYFTKPLDLHRLRRSWNESCKSATCATRLSISANSFTHGTPSSISSARVRG